MNKGSALSAPLRFIVYAFRSYLATENHCWVFAFGSYEVRQKRGACFISLRVAEAAEKRCEQELCASAFSTFAHQSSIRRRTRSFLKVVDYPVYSIDNFDLVKVDQQSNI